MTAARTPGLTFVGATAMYVSALLGAGILTLPMLAARIAGPASILAWAALLALSIPIGQTFAALAARHPGGEGTAGFVRAAFGDRAATIVGLVFWMMVPIGGPAAAMIGSTYVEDALGGGRLMIVVGAGVIVGLPMLLNASGIHVASRLQAVALAVLAGLVVVMCAGALPHGDPAHLVPFAPFGYGAVAPAMGLLFFSFAGWEASTHLSGELADPERQTRRIAWATLAILTVLYLGLAATTILVLGPRGGDSEVPFTTLLAYLAPGVAPGITAALAVVLTFGAANTYLAGVTRLGAAFAHAGVLPAFLRETGTPRRNIAAFAVLTGVSLTVIGLFGVSMETLIGITSATLAVVTTGGLAAGVKLLDGLPRAGAAIGTALMVLVCAFAGPYLLGPAIMALFAVVLVAWRGRRGRARTP